jgi:hypothetical protein
MKLLGLRDENGEEYEIYLTRNEGSMYKLRPVKSKAIIKDIGDWIVLDGLPDKSLARIIKVCDELGWLAYEKYEPDVSGSIGFQYCRVASEKEIETYLMSIALKKGLTEDPEWILSAYPTDKFLTRKVSGFYYDPTEDSLTWNGICLYYKGQWATKIPKKKPLPRTKGELKDLLQYVASQSDNIYQRIREILDDYED